MLIFPEVCVFNFMRNHLTIFIFSLPTVTAVLKSEEVEKRIILSYTFSIFSPSTHWLLIFHSLKLV